MIYLIFTASSPELCENMIEYLTCDPFLFYYLLNKLSYRIIHQFQVYNLRFTQLALSSMTTISWPVLILTTPRALLDADHQHVPPWPDRDQPPALQHGLPLGIRMRRRRSPGADRLPVLLPRRRGRSRPPRGVRCVAGQPRQRMSSRSLTMRWHLKIPMTAQEHQRVFMMLK